MSTSDEYIASETRGCETLTVRPSIITRTTSNHQKTSFNKCNFHNNIIKCDRTRQTPNHPLPYLTCTKRTFYEHEDKFRRNCRRRSTLWSLRSNVTTFVIILFCFVTTSSARTAKNKIPLFETDGMFVSTIKSVVLVITILFRSYEPKHLQDDNSGRGTGDYPANGGIAIISEFKQSFRHKFRLSNIEIHREMGWWRHGCTAHKRKVSIVYVIMVRVICMKVLMQSTPSL